MRKININKILFLGITLVFLSSCGEEFLDRTPFSSYTTENFFETEEQVQQAVNGLYGGIRSLQSGAMWQIGDFRTDNTTFQFNAADRGAQGFESIDYYLAESNEGLFNGMWGNLYNTISKCHFVLENVNEVEYLDGESRQGHIAEARFVRAYCYHLLTKYFGKVPLVDRVITDEEEASPIRRTEISTIYDQLLVPDLNFAIENLPAKQDDKNSGRASGDAARMVLANSYFTINDYESALPILEEVVNSDRYQLLPDYRAVFIPEEAFNDEIIWNVQFNTDFGQGAGFFINWLPQNSGEDITGGVFIGSLAGKHIPTPDMIRAFEPGDKRFDASVAYYKYDDNDSIAYIRKYLFPPFGSTGSDIDIPVYRLADAQLMYAEAFMEVNGSLSDDIFFILNDLRVRAGLPLYFPGNPVEQYNIDTPEKLKQAIRQERRVELAFEMKRYDDLVRWDILEETMIAHGEEMKQIQDFLDIFPDAYTNIPSLLPIPFGQIELWGYEQNPGW